MRTLVIDCATEACSVALFEDGLLLAGDFRMLGRGHAEHLVPMVSGLPERGRAERIAVSLGPGSFTGLRVGLAAARAFGFAWKADLMGFPTLALVAAIARDRTGNEPVGVAMTGGHGEWFVEGFDERGATTRPLASLSPSAAIAASHEFTIAGSEAEALVERRGRGRPLAMWPDARAFPLLPSLALSQKVQPLYGRPPDARPIAGAPI